MLEPLKFRVEGNGGGSGTARAAANSTPPRIAPRQVPQKSHAANRPLAATLRSEYWIVAGVLLVGLLHGLLYVFIMPPWQHYEEPSHFEYAWLIASRRELPEYPAYDQDKRREIASSMIKHGFFHDLGFFPNLDAPPDEPIWIGINVTGALPLYPILVALPLSVIPHADIETQLYVGRLVSLCLYLGTIALAYLVARELVPPGHILRWGLPAVIALLPGFTDLMTAVNNDVGATFVFSLFLWASLRLILHGVTISRLLAATGAALLCLLTKTTVFVAAPLLILALLFAWLRERWKPVYLLVPLALGILIAMICLDWGDAAFWYRDTLQESPTRVETDSAPLGRYALGLTVSPAAPISQVQQPILLENVGDIKGQAVTIGAWIWATHPTQARLAVTFDGSQQGISHPVEVVSQPAFYAFNEQIPADIKRIHLALQADNRTDAESSNTVYFDAVVLLAGTYPIDVVPQFYDPQGIHGVWGDISFVNLARNPSAEKGWTWVAPWFEKLRKHYPWSAHLDTSTLLASAMDWDYSSQMYRVSASNILETFWARFGWAHVSLSSPWWYWFLKRITLFGAVGSTFVFWYAKDKPSAWKLGVGWLFVTLITIWGGVVVRGFVTLLSSQVFIPSARYGYPAIIPTMFLLLVGWGWLLDRIRKYMAAVTLFGFVILDIVSIFSILQFYAGR